MKSINANYSKLESLKIVQGRIDEIKRKIKSFKRKRKYGWTLLCFTQDKKTCDYFINKHKELLRFEVFIKRRLIKSIYLDKVN